MGIKVGLVGDKSANPAECGIKVTSDKIVPFGRHRGRPIDAIVADVAYTSWLCSQNWFRSQHPDLYAAAINNGISPDETPEHNKMQGKFLDRDFRVRFGILMWTKTRAADEARKYLISMGCDPSAFVLSPEMTDDDIRVQFEVGYFAIDVVIDGKLYFPGSRQIGLALDDDLRFGIRVEEQRIECKPFLGDDYPAVLRQMRRSGANVLYVGSFESEAISYQGLVEFFRLAGITVIGSEP